MHKFPISFPFTVVLLITILLHCAPKNQDNVQILSSIDYVDPLIGTGIATTESALKHSVSGSEITWSNLSGRWSTTWDDTMDPANSVFGKKMFASLLL